MYHDYDEHDHDEHEDDGQQNHHKNGQSKGSRNGQENNAENNSERGNDPEEERAVNELLMVSLFAATMSANAGSLRGQLGMLRGKFESGEWPGVVQRSYEQVEMATEMLASEYERIAKKVIDDYRAQHLQNDQDTPDDSP